MKVTIVIAAFNAEKTIKKCVRTLLNQVYDKPYELIIINDGSTDKTKEIAQAYCKKHDNITLINQFNKGVCVARNKGIQASKGEYVINMGADCFAEPYFIQELLEPFEDSRIGIVSSFDYYGGSGTAFPRKLLHKVRGYSKEFYFYREDTDLSFKIMKLGYKFKLIPRNFDHYDGVVKEKRKLNSAFKYGFERARLHMNDVLLFKRHSNLKECHEFFKVKFGFMISPYWDFSCATGIWDKTGETKFSLSSPRGYVFLENKNNLDILKIIGLGVCWVLLVKFFRLAASLRYGVLLI